MNQPDRKKIRLSRKKVRLSEFNEDETSVSEQLSEINEQIVILEKVLKPLDGVSIVAGENGLDGTTPTNEELLDLITPLIPEPITGAQGEQGIPGERGDDGLNGIDGLNGTNGKDGADGKNGEPGKDGSPDSPEQVRDKLSSLKGNERLDASAIKNLPKFDYTKLPQPAGAITYRLNGAQVGRGNVLNLQEGTGITITPISQGNDQFTYIISANAAAIGVTSINGDNTPAQTLSSIDGSITITDNLTGNHDFSVNFPASFITAISDTNSIDLTVTGTTLSADSRISATVGNTIVINADGLFVPATTIVGTDTQVLYFDGANNPAGDAGMTYNDTTDTLTLVGSVIAGVTFLPDANDGAALGTSALAFSDLFLAEGGVINWDAGDVTITQTGNDLAFAGANTYRFDGIVSTTTAFTLEETGAGTDVITIQAPASIAAGYTITLPVDDGNNLEFLQTNGAGVTAWATIASAGGLVFPTVSTPARTLNTNFTPSATRPTFVIYSISIECDDADSGRVELRSDAAVTPTTVRCTISNQFNVTGILGVAGETIITLTLSYIVPANENVRLVPTTVAGTPTFTIISQTEETL